MTNARRNMTVIFAFFAACAVVFQNCERRFGFEAIAPSGSEFSQSTFITINEGAAFTKDAGVRVGIRAPLAEQMYVTNDPTCGSGGAWEPLRTTRPWTLGQSNSQANVYVQFRASSGAQLPCMSAYIIHDDIAPKPKFLKTPSAIVGNGDALFSVDADDHQGGSGVSHFECQSVGSTSFAKCDSTTSLRDLIEGQQRFLVRAVDRAGNVSNPIESTWLIDTSPPSIRFTETPAALSSKSSAIFRFEASDLIAGVESMTCQFDADGTNGAPISGCTSPFTVSNLGSETAVKQYRFSVFARDKAGNISGTSSYTFSVDRSPSGEFDIIGVSGGDDVTPDKLLGTVPNPTVTWVPSQGATKYSVSILNSTDQVVCAAMNVDAPAVTYAYAKAACTLVDGGSYKARVSAVNALGNIRTAPLFPFKVDLSPPVISIAGPVQTNDEKDSEFTFSVIDPNGIESSVCTRTLVGGNASNDVVANCKDLTKMKYTNLNVGSSYTFSITAVDKAGNRVTSTPITWRVNQIVCDPFSEAASNCVKGLRANLYYLTGTQKTSITNVDRYISEGTVANVVIYLSQLFVPTRYFDAGFVTTSGSLVRDNSGNPLKEYFALDIQTIVKLDPTKDTADTYQFAMLSDDGSIVQVRPSAGGAWTDFITNDGDHNVRVGCSLTPGVTMTTATRLPMRIKYYQGPKYHIAAILLWRPMPTKTAERAEAECGTSHDNDYYFGKVDDLQAKPNLVDYGYGNLVKRGWRPLGPGNFIMDETAPTATPTPAPTP